jgi:3-oxoacyl-[acyl-carrier-protein] synthase-3
MSEQTVGILGTAMYLPEGRMTAAELAARTGGAWSERSVIEKLGIEEKTVAGPGDGAQEMGARAAMSCLARAGVDPMDVDAILCIGDELREYPMTTSGIYIQERIGARRAWALDVMQKCSTFAAGIRLARALMLAEPQTRTVLLAGGYRNGDMVDYTNPRVSFMYNLAPGGGAVLLRRGHGENEIIGTALRSDGALARLVVGRYGGTEAPVGPDNAEEANRCLDVTDQEQMRTLLAERSMPNFVGVVDDALAQAGLGRRDIGFLAVLHMKRSAHEEMLRALGVPVDRSIYLSRYGHVGQLDQILSLELGVASGRIEAGTVVVCVGAGIGYSWGAVAIRWGAGRAVHDLSALAAGRGA